MDAKDRANFIISLNTDQGNTQTCTACGAVLEKNATSCSSCGAAIAIQNVSAEPAGEAASPFAPIKDNVQPPKAETVHTPQASAVPVQQEEKVPISEVEEVSAFALGLPEWNLEPPQTFVRRK